MEAEKPKRGNGFSSGQAIAIGLALLIPFILVASFTHLIPLTKVFATAQTDGNLMRESEYVGAENYDKLANDPNYLRALSNTLPYAIMRIIIAAVIPALVGGLIGSQARVGRIINRLVLSLITVLIVPISIGLLWSSYWGQLWGTDPSPVFSEALFLGSPEGATSSLQYLDALIVTAIAALVGGTIFIAVMRGRSRLMAGIAVGIIGVIIAGASGFLVFDMPFVLTGGGPANSTTTLAFQIYTSGFRYFDMGYASAQASFIGIGALLVGLIIGLISIGFNLRLIPIPSRQSAGRENNVFGALSIPILLIILLPLIGLVLWGFNLAQQNESFAKLNDAASWATAQSNSVIPWFAIWFVHLPITFMAGLSLGFIRPFGKIGTNIVFVILLMITIIPTEVLVLEWFLMSREMGLLNNSLSLGLPWLTNGFSLLVFKVLFDGLQDYYFTGLNAGESSQHAFSNRVMLPGLLMALAIGIILSFISSQSLLWAIVSQNNPDNYTPPLILAQLRNYGIDSALLTAGASQLIWENFIIFLLLFAGVQVFFFDRFKLEAGLPMEIAFEDDEFMDNDVIEEA